MIILACLLVVGVLVTSKRTSDTQPTLRVYVNEGETYWSIAARHPVPGQTTEQTAEEIAHLNGSGRGVLRAGEAIRVPAPSTDTVAVARR